MNRLIKSETLVFIALVTLIIAVSVVCLILFWDWLGTGVVPAESNGEKIRNVSIVIGGIIALVFAIWRSVVSGRQAKTAQQNLIQERYHNGTKMLGSDLLAVRLGGIYALQQLSSEDPDKFHIPIAQLLCAFLRHPLPPGEDVDCPTNGEDVIDRIDHMLETLNSGKWREPSLRSRQDTQAIMDILSKRDAKIRDLEVANHFRLDLRGADLRNVWLQRGNFCDSELAYANLMGAFCVGTNLSATYLAGANLSLVIFIGVDLSSSFIEAANLSGARLTNSRMSEANLKGSNLRSVDFLGSNLSGAKLSGAKFQGANLWGVNLSGANLTAEVGQSCRYRLPAMGLTQSQLDEARADPDNPPKLNGVVDADTGKQLTWNGKPWQELSYDGLGPSVDLELRLRNLRLAERKRTT